MIDYFSVSYVNHVVVGDLILEPSTGLLKNFMNSNALHNLDGYVCKNKIF